ncbi:tRNA (cytidine(34)-2'-O)-methyltransferase [hydrothermal vent metagenome]|uniref:tRNA (Cytidine(34)-2'-O)-methyltransferase n=1 Tax=hydrothermal vent metagenome TaxID=652676 RepID=A0A3B0T2H1_9ZZZZ
MTMRPALALYQPDIPQNTGTLLRLGACLGVEIHIVGPPGFRLDDRALKRAGLDYIGAAALQQHIDWPDFETWRRQNNRRLVLATTRGATPYTKFAFSPTDVLLLGRETAGVPDRVHDAAAARLAVPMVAGMRSLNVAVAGAMIIAEALRQTDRFPVQAKIHQKS